MVRIILLFLQAVKKKFWKFQNLLHENFLKKSLYKSKVLVYIETHKNIVKR